MQAMYKVIYLIIDGYWLSKINPLGHNLVLCDLRKSTNNLNQSPKKYYYKNYQAKISITQ